MKVKVAKWGNSLGVRLPKAAADAAGLHPGTEVDIMIEGFDLRLKPITRSVRYRLEDMIAEMKRLGGESAPETVDWGADRGSENIADAYTRGETTLDDLLKRPGAAKRAGTGRRGTPNAHSRRR